MDIKTILAFINICLIVSCSTANKRDRNPSSGHAKILKPNESSDTYGQIKAVLASDPETPDCSHKSYGPHITQAVDSDLGHEVFVFHLHVRPDDDRCVNSDRQRIEIKTMGNALTPDYLKGFLGDTVIFRWRFKLPIGFQSSYSFTHLHQLKAFDGDDDLPLITLTTRKDKTDVIQIIHIDSKKKRTFLSSETPLASFIGTWVEVYEKVTYGPKGSYEISIKKVLDETKILSYSNPNLDLWRSGTTVIRPKWGIYRSLEHAEELRDESVSFDEFCLAKDLTIAENKFRVVEIFIR